MADLLSGLNEKQREAVLTTEGPVMVMAGAGSGKTRVLTRRIAYLINDLGVNPYSILAVTFTNKAAREMKERITDLLGIDTKFMWVSTFHSFCTRLLRVEAKYLGGMYTSNFQILDDEDTLKIIKKIVKELNLDDDIKPSYFKNLISQMKNFPDFKLSDPFKERLLESVYNKYQEYLALNNAFDFDDLLLKTVEVIKNNPEILTKYQDKFNYILVDEFQDTNKVQFELISLLAARYQNIFVVGDEDQSIYSFRGALVTNIRRFREVFPLTKLILLEENYRSTKAILDLANKVIKYNSSRVEKNLFTEKVDSIKPYYFKAVNSYEEVIFVLEKIKELLNKDYSYKDFAVLYRANYISRNFEDVFVKNKIPYVIYGGMSFFSRKEIKDVVAYLRLILNNNDNLSFLRIVNEPKRKIGTTTLEKLDKLASDNNLSLFEAIPLVNNSNLNKFYELINFLKDNILNYELNDYFDLLVDKTNYLEYLKSNEEKERIENLNEFKSVLNEARDTYEGDNVNILASLLQDLSLRTDTDNKNDDDNVVKLMTFHQAKGLEFKVVFMVALEEGIFPSVNAYSPSDLEEERRICYVGITRACERLYLSAANVRLMYGREEYHTPSRFINEMELIHTPNVKPLVIKPKEISKPKVEIGNIFKVGDKVNHKVFGNGLVVSVEGKFIKVAFPVPYGIKTILANHPAIIKIK